MSEKMEKHREGMIIKDDDTPEKMQVEHSDVHSSGDYNESPVFIYYEWCKKCGICVEFCPKGVLALDKEGKVMVKYPDKCISCGLCEMRCPDIAIELV